MWPDAIRHRNQQTCPAIAPLPNRTISKMGANRYRIARKTLATTEFGQCRVMSVDELAFWGRYAVGAEQAKFETGCLTMTTLMRVALCHSVDNEARFLIPGMPCSIAHWQNVTDTETYGHLDRCAAPAKSHCSPWSDVSVLPSRPFSSLFTLNQEDVFRQINRHLEPSTGISSINSPHLAT